VARLPIAAFKVPAAAGPPKLTITGPRHQRITCNSHAHVADGRRAARQAREEHANGIDHDLGVISKTHGTLTFTPLAGRPTRRTIIAYITQNHLPRTAITVAHYTMK
jgi:hypothetical protein